MKKPKRKLGLAREMIRNLAIPEQKAVVGGFVVQTDFASDCYSCAMSCWDTSCCSMGRRPEGLVDVEAAGGEAIGVFFANASRMEAASVPAFIALRDELVMHGAAAELVERAEYAMDDEVRHTRITAALARRFGAREGAWGDPPKIERRGNRSVEAIALENAVEGCVNEAYAALLVTWQGAHAVDPSVSAAMRKIADDERRHAELARSVATWLDTKLDDASRSRIDAAVEHAACELVRNIAPFPPELVAAGLGPEPAEQARMIESLLSSLES